MLPAVVAATVVLSLGTAPPPAGDHPQIVELYPNPAAMDDDGEFVRLWVPPETALGEYAISDGQTTVPLPSVGAGTGPDIGNGTLPRPPPESGFFLTLSTDPELTGRLTDRRVLPLDDRLRLANSGDHVRLLHEGAVVDDFQYEDAPEGDVYNATRERWHPLAATDLPVVTGQRDTVEAFVLPDEGDRAVELLEAAEQRILLAGYTLTSQRAVEALIAADRRGVAVEVLVDSSPVGGMSDGNVAALDTLAEAGIPVRVSGGQRARYRFHHAKYAVVDGRALVTTENWKPAGTGGRGSRGWAVITPQPRIVDGLVETYRADTQWADAIPWQEFEQPTPVDGEPATGEYPTEFPPQSVPVNRTKLLVAPDNAESELSALIRTAEDAISVKQVRIGDRSFPLLERLLAAAERGVEVRVLLSGAWYVKEENEQLAAWLSEQAKIGELPLRVRVADPNGRFEKIHAKGMIVDGDAVALGSLNWNSNSLRQNREVVVVLEGEAVAGYFEAVFDADWGDRSRRLPVGVVVACLLAALFAALGAVRLQFEQ